MKTVIISNFTPQNPKFFTLNRPPGPVGFYIKPGSGPSQTPVSRAKLMPKILIIIPTYNEVENLPRLLVLLQDLKLDLDVLVIDDNSPDGTGKWARENLAKHPNLHLIEREGKLGLGSAYVRGFRFALENQYEFVFEMDADFSHDPAYIPVFLETIQNYDIVLGSRYINGVTVVNWPMSRLLLSYFANIYARWE